MRGVVVERVGAGENFLLGARDVAQHRVDQRGEGRRAGVEPRRADRQIHRGVIRDIEKQQLRRRHDQNPFERPGSFGQALFQKAAERLADRAQTPKRDGRDRSRQRAIARVEPGGPALESPAPPRSSSGRARIKTSATACAAANRTASPGAASCTGEGVAPHARRSRLVYLASMSALAESVTCHPYKSV